MSPPERCKGARGFGSLDSSSSLPGALVEIKKDRLDVLIKAEMTHFAHALKPHPLALQDLLEHREPNAMRVFLLKELPVRYAGRVRLIENLDGWQGNPHLRAVKNIYSDAFSRLRLLTSHDAVQFRALLISIERPNILQHLLRGVGALKQAGKLADWEVNSFLDHFLTQRIGTNIMTSQYLALTKRVPSSVIDAECDPFAQMRVASDDAVRLCRFNYGHAPSVDMVSVGEVRFPFIPQYLNYVGFELLKNALRAVTERYGERCVDHPVRVIISGDERVVVIRVSDEGGGIPYKDVSKVWSYTYTTATEDVAASEDDDMDEQVAPMFGFGCGLPLSRNYAKYVGGRLLLNSMPSHGTNAYLYLNRLGDAKEIGLSQPSSFQPSSLV